MKTVHLKYHLLIFALSAILTTGCGHKESDAHDHSEESEHTEEHGHDHDEPVSGATFKPGKGVIVSDETRQILGIEISDVMQEKMPKLVRLNIQIFGETHRYFDVDMDHAGCDVHGSGFLMPDQALLVEPKQPVKVLTPNNQSLDGFVLSVQRTLAQGEIEVLVGVKDAATKLKDGDFATAVISIPREEPIAVIPHSALLRTAEGTFAYVVNDDAFYRKAVHVGSETDKQAEITDGLSVGDQVVVKPVETLWLIELRATKGGGHSH